MSRGNGYGNHRSTRDKIMAEHDALDPDLRFLSCNAVANWSPATFDSHYCRQRIMGKSHRAAVQFVAQRITDWEAEDTLKDYGPTHPEATPSRPRQKQPQ